ncbi:hypothetical protein SEA_FLAGSTAFF_38 [Mycobacterium phage FlagStaff]|uniref:Uncharacterized protein n=1 Tax=Mycobacterium phage FlagStaff TaxID=1647304 RepID=A0A0F6WE94_9CAUD|nr:hypothetical protein AVT49_gp38 [Mycobacterium phage FlagStaff]AKF14475.1 hypothetical protein SEA_FLAGSTAFF_38 [Mycobacterium phage FlagStaff]
MNMILGGLAAGLGIALTILLVGLTVAAYLAIAVALVAIAWGAVDYVRSHPDRSRG